MIVDDEDSALEYGAALLAMQGFAVTPVSSGREALRLVLARPFDILVTDHVTVDSKGTPIVRALKTLRPDAKVIVISAIPTLKDAAKSYLAGAEAYLPKPYSFFDLQAAVRRCLGG